jgi:hypothetical protein
MFDIQGLMKSTSMMDHSLPLANMNEALKHTCFIQQVIDRTP